MPARRLLDGSTTEIICLPFPIDNRLARNPMKLKALFQAATPPAAAGRADITIEFAYRGIDGSILVLLALCGIDFPAAVNPTRSEYIANDLGNTDLIAPDVFDAGDWVGVTFRRNGGDATDTLAADLLVAETLNGEWTNVAL